MKMYHARHLSLNRLLFIIAVTGGEGFGLVFLLNSMKNKDASLKMEI